MNSKCLLVKPEVLLYKLEIGDQIGGKIQRENGYKKGKIQSNLSTYDHIGARQTYISKIKIL